MQDTVFEAFLQGQYQAALELNRSSDLVRLVALDDAPVRTYAAEFSCRALAYRNGDIVTVERSAVGIHFPSNYLREFDTAQVFTWLGPPDIWHPNVVCPALCGGHIPPGTPLQDLVYQVFDIITFSNVSMDENDALNRAACAWARRNLHRFPVDTRPMKWKQEAAELQAVSKPSKEA